MKKIYLKTLVLCVTVLVSLILKAQPCNNTTTYLSGSTCQGVPYIFNGVSLDTSGTYNDTILLTGGCDSIISLQLFVTPIVYNEQFDTICQGSSFVFVGQTLTQAGIYGDTLFSVVTGCDSILRLHLAINNAPHPTDTINATFCRTGGGGGGGSYYNFYGRHLRNTGTYVDTVAGSGSCDSIIVLNLTVVQAGFTPPQNATICAGQTYNFNGHLLTTAGTYLDTLQTSTGCDSIIRLTLAIGTSVQPPAINATVCPGQLYSFRGHNYAPGAGGFGGGGTYLDTVAGAAGCDTIFTIRVRQTLNVPTYTVVDSFCQGSLYIYKADTFRTAGIDTAYLPASAGCDTVVSLRLIYKIGPPTPTITRTGNILVAVATGNLTFQWYLNGQAIAGDTTQAITATQNGTYNVEVSESGFCVARSADFYVVNIGIQEISNLGSFKLYPNPNTGVFTLETQQYKGTEIMIYDVFGRAVFQKQLQTATETVDLNNAANGTYYLVMKNNNAIRYAHFVIAR